jgi:hypothetical protein
MERLEVLFPHLRGTAYRITSPASDVYNCIAWAAGDTEHWWWPSDPARTYWPLGAPRRETLETFRNVLATLGYVVCEQADLKPGFEQIALFAEADGTPTHAARQLRDGTWTSKLGMSKHIQHALEDLTSAAYGSVAQILKRVLPPSPVETSLAEAASRRVDRHRRPSCDSRPFSLATSLRTFGKNEPSDLAAAPSCFGE